jgi:hypothetical protein
MEAYVDAKGSPPCGRQRTLELEPLALLNLVLLLLLGLALGRNLRPLLYNIQTPTPRKHDVTSGQRLPGGIFKESGPSFNVRPVRPIIHIIYEERVMSLSLH